MSAMTLIVRPRHTPRERRAGRWLALLALLSASAAQAADAQLFELQPIQKDHRGSYATGINSLGQVVGTSGFRVNDAWVVQQAAYWGDPLQRATRLPTPAGVLGSAAGINDAGVVAGRLDGAAVTWSPAAPVAPYGLAQPLGTLSGGKDFGVRGIGNDGTVIGSYWKCAASDCSTGNTRAWKWDAANGMQPIGPDTGYWTYANDVNAAGSVLVGNTTSANESRVTLHAPDGTVTELAIGSGVVEYWLSMNDYGHVAGSRLRLLPSGPAVFDGFVWSDGVERALTPLVPDLDSITRAINNAGWVVGQARTASLGLVAALWVGDQAWDLNTLLAPDVAALWTLTEAIDINDSGWIVGNGRFLTEDEGVQARGFMLQLSSEFIGQLPAVPEPGTWALMLAGLGVLTRLAGARRA
jgi:uncharacterized membrane protein